MSGDAAAQPPEFEEREISLRDYLDILHRRRWIIIGAFVLVLGVAVGVSLAMPSVYRASATVTTDKTPPVLLLDQGSKFSIFGDQAAAQAPDVFTLAELIKSETVREGAVVRLTALLGTEAAEVALDRFSVQQIRNTELVRINVEHTDPRVAAASAGAVAQSLIDMNLKARRQRATETREFIQAEMKAARTRLREAEDALEVFRDRHAEVSLTQETSLNLQKLADLQAQLVDLRLQRSTIGSRIAAARDRLTTQAKIAPTQWTPSPLIASLQEQVAKFEIELSGLRREFTGRHPAIISTQAKVDEARQRLRAELARSLSPGVYGVDPVYQQLAQDLAQGEIGLAALNSRERALQAAIAGYNRRVRGMPTREAELVRLSREVKEAEQIYLLLSEKFQDARVAETSIGSAIRVVDAAKVPEIPVKPRRQLNTLLGSMLGLMIGAAAAFVVEQLDDTVKTSDDVERALGAPVLGAIPVMNGTGGNGQKDDERLPLLSKQERRSPAAEAYRSLRTHVLFSMPDVERKRLLITSALPREGKSTVAANLAVAIARTDRRVWLVDSDLRRPSLGKWFPGGASPGLASLLAGQAEIADVVRPAGEPNLWCVDSGPTVPNPAELLGAQRMTRLMEHARGQADVVLMDSPPVLPVTDAEVAAAQADGVLLVVKIGETSRSALAHARRRLTQVGAKVVGAVLNFAPVGRRGGYYYGAYYHAYYGNGDAGDGAAAAAPQGDTASDRDQRRSG